MIEITVALANQLLEKNARETYGKANKKHRSRLSKQLELNLKSFISEKYPGLLIDFTNLNRQVTTLLADGKHFVLNTKTRDTSKFLLFCENDL